MYKYPTPLYQNFNFERFILLDMKLSFLLKNRFFFLKKNTTFLQFCSVIYLPTLKKHAQIKRQTKYTATKVKEHKPGVETIRVLQSVRIIVGAKNNIAPTNNDTLALRGAKIEQDEIDIKRSLSEQQTEQDINQSPHIPTMRLCTYEQVKKMIHHIVENNLSIKEASRRANMSVTSALKYYKKYVEDPEHNIPIP
jgi:hypothetical protein